MKIITYSILIILVSQISYSNDCVTTTSGYNYCHPYDCKAIIKLRKSKLAYSSDRENLGSLKWQCRSYMAGKSFKQGKDTAIDTGKKLGGQILEKSGIGSFLKGWGS